MARRAWQPWRPLAGLLAVLVVAYAIVFTQGYVPRLGLDLEGGTSVVLTPLTEAQEPPDEDQLTEAVNIIRQRVDGLGVEEAEVVTAGDNIVVSVPGAGRDLLETVGSTAQLRFRPVLQGPFPADLDEQAVQEQAAQDAAGAGADADAGADAPASDPDAPDPATGQTGEGGTPEVQPGAPDDGAAVGEPSPAAQGRVAPSLAQGPAPAPDAEQPAPGPDAEQPAPPRGDQPAAPDSPPVAPPAGEGTPGAPQPPGATLQDLLALDCAEADASPSATPDAADEAVVACERQVEGEARLKYLLGPAVVEGTAVTNAIAAFDPDQAGGWLVQLDFDRGGANAWADYTTANVGQQVGIVLDRTVVSAPRIETAIIGGQTQITGDFSQPEAEALSSSLRYGALPLTFTTSQVETVSPVLGSDQLAAGLVAALVGLVLVAVYSLLYYRGLGLVTIASLVVAAALTYAAVALLGPGIGFRLTLAGVAGLVVSIGITADSFVVYFERIKDEMRVGRSLRSAAERAWPRAFSTILAADVVQFLAAAILYFLAVGAVQNFAFTLGLTTIIDVLVIVVFSRPLVALIARSRRLSSPRFTGLTPQRLGGRSRLPSRGGSGSRRVEPLDREERTEAEREGRLPPDGDGPPGGASARASARVGGGTS